MTDKQDVAPGLDQALRLAVNLAHQRAGGIDIIEPARLGRRGDEFGHAMRRKHHRPTVGNFVEILDEHRALTAQLVDDEAVVDDFVTHIDRWTEALDRQFYDMDCAVDPGAKPARGGDQKAERGQRRGSGGGLGHADDVSDCLQP